MSPSIHCPHRGEPCVHPPILEWFIGRVETFAPTVWHTERQLLYTELMALPAAQERLPGDHIGLFVLAQVVAAHQLATPVAAGKTRRGRTAHETWYSKERQRIAKLLQQLDDSPVVAAFHATIRYYPAEAVTCPHGRNQKTCDTLYALRLTLQLLERYPALPGVRKQVERLRQLEPHLPLLHDLCPPQDPPEADDSVSSLETPSLATEFSGDSRVLYLLGTVVGRLRQAGLSVAQSCDVVDRLLSYCFGQLDASGTRSKALAEQWRLLC